jgi:hypothetical protein
MAIATTAPRRVASEAAMLLNDSSRGEKRASALVPWILSTQNCEMGSTTRPRGMVTIMLTID